MSASSRSTSACAPTAPWNARSTCGDARGALEARQGATASMRSRSCSCTPTAIRSTSSASLRSRASWALRRCRSATRFPRSIKLVGRGDTTVVDAYLSPILRRYVAQVDEELEPKRSGCAADVHDVLGRAHGRRPVPGQGCDPVGAGRRRGRHGAKPARQAGLPR